MKSNFFNKAKLSCKTIAMILVAAIVIVSVDGCGKSETGVSSGTGAGVKTIQVDTAVDRIPAEPIEEAALALQAAYEKLEASTGYDAAFAQALQAFHETLVKYQSVYNGTEGEKDKEYQSRIETVLHQAEELENVNLTDREQKMNLLRQYMEEPDSVHTYGDQLIEGDEPDVETRKVESFEAAREKMENAAEEEVDGTPKGKQKTAGRKNLLTEGPTALSDVMKAKADELKTPLAIYNELKNTLQYENYCGSRKGAIAAYDALSGNDVDQASVLIAMLRYLGYEAVYAEGDILLDPDQAMALTGAGNVTAAANALALGGKKSTLLVAGGKPAGVSIRHTWVRTLVPYGDYRGAGKNRGKSSGSIWMSALNSMRTPGKISMMTAKDWGLTDKPSWSSTSRERQICWTVFWPVGRFRKRPKACTGFAKRSGSRPWHIFHYRCRILRKTWIAMR